MADDMTDKMNEAIEYNRDRAEIEELKRKLEILVETLPDGRVKLIQENSLLLSQLANCNKEIKRLREELLRYAENVS
ncbi:MULTISPECIES: hypothetical protein [unclassified Bradyrhizobium]|uniref:hypothetical protein n=1 Tax=unclassified Bradyrhizobium TaxID=2631580 RepID=UPI0028E6180D|nr:MULTISPECIES: hypothetical protein [unclassified Bradyrhizobium]